MQGHATPIISGEPAILARRYASALYDLAQEQKSLDSVADELRGLQKMVRESADFRAFAADPRLSRTAQVKAARDIAAAAKIGTLTGNLLALMAQNRRLTLIDATISAYLTQLAARRGEFSATVRSARPLSAAQTEQLAAGLHDLAGGKVSFTVTQDAGLLGGLVVQMGSRLIDASLKSRLARMERQLKSQSNPQAGAA